MTSVAAAPRRKAPDLPSVSGPSLAHVGFQGARHMHPERVPSARKERTTSIRLFDTSEDTLDNVEDQSKDVKILMVNGLNMNKLTDGLVNRMLLLQKLDLSENQLGDASLPEAFKKLEHLVELNLSKNKFTKVPPVIKKLKNLTRLSLSTNNVDSLKGIEHLKRMQVLVLDHNKLSSVFKDITHMRKLEILDCSHNNIREVGIDIRFLKNLKELNISKNKISVLPTDLFKLTKLESLKVSQNQVSKIPVFNMNPQHCHTISDVDLSNNTINKFPGHLLTISQKLDLSANRIKTLEWNKIKKLDLSSGKELFVDGNPLTFPPADVCECGLKAMMRFFQETELNTKVYQGIKILVLGSPGSGKTSFIHTLVDGQPRLSEEMYESSAGIEVSDMIIEDVPETRPPPTIQAAKKSNVQGGTRRASRATAAGGQHAKHAPLTQHVKETRSPHVNGFHNNLEDTHGDSDETSSNASTSGKRSLEMCIWDFCGHPFYLFPHYMFFEQPAIAILTFNMFTYRSEHFEDMISSWFDWMIAKTNKLCVLLVGTHADKLNKEQIKKVNNEVIARLQAHAERQRQIVQRKIDVITEKPHISQTLSAQLNAYSLLLQEKFVVQSEVIITSAASNTGFQTVFASIEMLSNDSRQFPNVLRTIPTFWLEVQSFLEEKGNTMVVPVVKYEEIKEEVSAKFGMKHLFATIVQYLHETGKALWFANNPSLKGLVILRPTWFFDIFRSLFRHDLVEKLEIEVEDSFKIIAFDMPDNEEEGITQGRYDQMKEEFLAEGVVDRDLLKCMMCHLLPLQSNGHFLEVLTLLLEALDLGYLVTKKSTRDGGYNLDPETEGMFSKKYLIPWFREVPEPPCVQEAWAPLDRKQRLAGVCRFPKYMPPGLFEMLSVRAHREKHNLRFLSHWGSGFHARHKLEKLQVMFSYSKHNDDNGTTIRFELRDDTQDPNADQVSGAGMWSILLPILMDLEELLHSYTGVLVERLMECPSCKLLTFIGEWLTPKETQGMATRPCEECNENIDTAFLVQPREKKRDDVRFNLAKIRQKKRVALAGPDDTNLPATYHVHANVRVGRRTAILPMENVTVDPGARSSVSSATYAESDAESTDYDESRSSRRTTAVGTLPGLSEEEMASFLEKTSKHEVNERGSVTPDNGGSQTLPGLDPAQMAAFLNKHFNNNGVDTDVIDDDVGFNDYRSDASSKQLLPGLNAHDMALLSQRLNANNDDAISDDDGNGDVSNGKGMQLLPGLTMEQMAMFLQNQSNNDDGTSDEDDVTTPPSFLQR